MGCMGVVYSAAIEVTDAYWLKEVRELRDLVVRQEELRDAPRAPTPTATTRSTSTRIPARATTTAASCARATPPRSTGAARVGPAAPALVDRAREPAEDHADPRQPGARHQARTAQRAGSTRLLGWLARQRVQRAVYKVLNIGAANVLPAYSAEIGVPLRTAATSRRSTHHRGGRRAAPARRGVPELADLLPLRQGLARLHVDDERRATR